MRGLKFDVKTIKETECICRYFHKAVVPKRKEIRKFASEVGENFALVLKAKYACGDDNAQKAMDIYKNILEKGECLYIKDLAISGNDIKSIGIENGKEVGAMLKFALETVLDEPQMNEKQKLMEAVKNRLGM